MKMSLQIALALSLIGAGPAFAACSPSALSAWSAVQAFQGSVVAAEQGLDGSECRMEALLQSNAGGAALAVVQDSTPNAEPRYRARFLINADAWTGQQLQSQVQVFSANSNAAGAGLRLGIFGTGGGQKMLAYVVKDALAQSGFRSGAIPLNAGTNSVEMELNTGMAGGVNFWVNSSAAERPTVALTGVNNAAFAGVDTVYMGVAAASPQFVASHARQPLLLDRFDSRRATFIGG